MNGGTGLNPPPTLMMHSHRRAKEVGEETSERETSKRDGEIDLFLFFCGVGGRGLGRQRLLGASLLWQRGCPYDMTPSQMSGVRLFFRWRSAAITERKRFAEREKRLTWLARSTHKQRRTDVVGLVYMDALLFPLIPSSAIARQRAREPTITLSNWRSSSLVAKGVPVPFWIQIRSTRDSSVSQVCINSCDHHRRQPTPSFLPLALQA